MAELGPIDLDAIESVATEFIKGERPTAGILVRRASDGYAMLY